MKYKQKRKRKRKIGMRNVLFGILFLMIIGGVVMIIKNYDDKNTIFKTNEKDQTKDEEERDVTSENVDSTNSSLERAPSDHISFLMLEDGQYLTDKGYTLVIENGAAYVDGNLIVNKTYSLPENYQPMDPVESITTERCNRCLDTEVMHAFELMQSDASSLGLDLYIASGYRSYTYQKNLYNNYSAVSGVEQADTYSARPGHSEHQTGLCFDLNSVNDSFANTDEGRWVNEHAYLYGFVIRYPKGKEHITGYQYESWHLRYVGEELASKLYQNGEWLTLEEYYGITSNYGV